MEDITKLLNDKLNVPVTEPNITEDGSKFGGSISQFNISRLINTNEYSVGIGPAIDSEHKLSLEDAIQKIADLINKDGCTVRFHSLYLPRHDSHEAKQHQTENVVSRRLIDYLPMRDQLIERIDVMVETRP